jgi:hypothetical protein
MKRGVPERTTLPGCEMLAAHPMGAGLEALGAGVI